MSFYRRKRFFTPGEWKTMCDIVEAHRDVTRWSNAKLNLFLAKITDELERRRMVRVEENFGDELRRSAGLKTPDPVAMGEWLKKDQEYRQMITREYGNN